MTYREKLGDGTIRITGESLNPDVGVWKTFAGVLGATTTAPTGWNDNGSRYMRIGDTVMVKGGFTFLSGMTPGTGTYTFYVPVPPSTLNDNLVPIGSAVAFDASGSVFDTFEIVRFTGNLVATRGKSGIITNSTPWVWAASDRLSYSLYYEAGA